MKIDQVVTESLADEFAAMARAKGMNVRVHGTPDEERARSQQILAQRAADREKASADAASADLARLPELKAELEQMKAEYDSLGGSNWQYADREQNLTDRERQARGMEHGMNTLANRVARAEKSQGVAEGYDSGDYYNASMGGEYGRDLSYVDNRRNSGISDKHERGGRDDIFKGQGKNLPADPFSRTSGAVPKADGTGRVHTIAQPDEVDEGNKKPEQPEADYGDDYQAMVSRVKKLAGLGPLKTVYDPQKRVYKNIPTAVQPKK